MLEYLRYIQRFATIRPKTCWFEFPFYVIIKGYKQEYCLGCRPEDLAHFDTIEKKVWKKHQAHLNRLERFPTEKAEYYTNLMKAHGLNSIRALSNITGEDWSYIARILRILDLAEPIKEFLKSNKNDPTILKFFHLRRLLDIIRQGEEKFQLARFRELMNEFEESSFLVR